MKWLKRTAIVVAILLAVLAAIPFFISLDDYKPRIEQEASAKLKEPVKIGSLRAGFLPTPHVTILGITVGKTDDIKVGKVVARPALSSLFSATKVIRSLEIDELRLTQKAIDKIPVWTKSDSSQPAAVRIESVRIDDAVIQLAKSTFGPLDARVLLNEKGEPHEANLATRDGKLKALIQPEGSNFRISATAKSWKLPAGPPIEFDELVLKGIATVKSADFSEVSAKLYGGSVVGKAALDWQKGFNVKGNFDVNGVELKNLASLFAPKVKVSGRLSAKPVLRATAADASQLANALRVETPFSVQNGVLQGFDIEKAATSFISKQGGSGGETRFDHLAGHMLMERGGYRFTNVKISSGALAADGNVTISAGRDLSGRVNAKVNAAGTNVANVPLNVSGTLDNPMLMPTGASIAGAVAGTAVLGPGLGTTVGAKIGNFADGLFGKKDEKKK